MNILADLVPKSMIVLGFFSITLLGITVYRLYLHPLARFPGPAIGCLTGLYHAYHAFKRDHAVNFYHLHQKYGPVVRYAPNMLSFSSVKAVEDIYVRTRDIRKADFYLAFPRDVRDASVLSSIDKKVHAKKRRILRSTFSDDALRAAEPAIIRHIHVFLDIIGSHEPDAEDQSTQQESGDGWTPSRNMAKWVYRCMFDVASAATFGTSFNTLQKQDTRFLIELIKDSLYRDNLTATLLKPLYHWGLRSWVFRDTEREAARFDALVKNTVYERIGRGNSDRDRDLIGCMIDASDPETGAKFTPSQLWEEALLFITAGGDTSSVAICSTLFYLSRHPPTLAKLRAELLSVFPDGAVCPGAGSALRQCAYLRAVIDEALRLAPPVASPLHRQVEAGGTTIDGYYVPADVDVGVSAYVLQHDGSLFPDPFAFVPERWLGPGGGSKKPRANLSASAFVPFSTGVRGCIGKPLAYLQVSLTVAALVLRFDFRFSPKHWANGPKSGEGPDPCEHYELADVFVSENNGPLLEFRPRTVGEAQLLAPREQDSGTGAD